MANPQRRIKNDHVGRPAQFCTQKTRTATNLRTAQICAESNAGLALRKIKALGQLHGMRKLLLDVKRLRQRDRKNGRPPLRSSIGFFPRLRKYRMMAQAMT